MRRHPLCSFVIKKVSTKSNTIIADLCTYGASCVLLFSIASSLSWRQQRTDNRKDRPHCQWDNNCPLHRLRRTHCSPHMRVESGPAAEVGSHCFHYPVAEGVWRPSKG